MNERPIPKNWSDAGVPLASLERLALPVILTLYVASFFLPAFNMYPSAVPRHDVWYGTDILKTGWMGAFVWHFGWYANLPYVYSLYRTYRKEYAAALFFCGIACLLSLDTFWILAEGIPHNGGHRKVAGIGEGALVWLAAVWGQAIVNYFLSRRHEKWP